MAPEKVSLPTYTYSLKSFSARALEHEVEMDTYRSGKLPDSVPNA